MRLKILFLIGIFAVLSCNTKDIAQVEDLEVPHFEFKSNEARNLYKQCLAYELVDANKLKEFAQKLLNLKDDEESQIIGTYYLLLTDFKTACSAESIDNILDFYSQIPQQKYDKLRLSIDFSIIKYYYHTYYYEGIAARIDLLSKYITRPEHWLERTAFRIYIRYEENDKDYDRLITDFNAIKDELNEYPWGEYHNLIYKSIARTYIRKNDEATTKKLFDYAKNKNLKHGTIALNIEILTETFYTLNKGINVLNEAEQISLQSGFKRNLSLIYRLKGHAFFNVKNFDKAYEQYDIATETDSLTNQVESYVYSNLYRGWAYFKKNPSRKTYNKSLAFYKLSEQKVDLIKEPQNYLQEIINRKVWALQNFGSLDEINKTKGEFYNLYNSKIGEKFTSDGLKRAVAQLTIKLSLKENEVNFLKISESANKQKITSQKIILALGLILVLSLIAFNYHRLKKAQEIKSINKVIHSQNIELQKSIHQLSENTNVLNKTNAQLQEVLDRRDKIIRRLKQFAYTLAHDLSDPLLAIKTFGFLLNKTATYKLNHKETEFLDFIIDASNRLNDKVDRLYKYSTNTLILFNDFNTLNVNKIISAIKQDLYNTIQDKKARVICDAIPPIKGDEILINQLFQNLITNALKFCKYDEHPIIRISSYEENNELIIVVKDNGIGIENASNTDVFELIQNAQQDEETKGKGIGLAIAKETVEIHSGRIWFNSDPVVGTTFYIAFKEYGENIKQDNLFKTAEVENNV